MIAIVMIILALALAPALNDFMESATDISSGNQLGLGCDYLTGTSVVNTQCIQDLSQDVNSTCLDGETLIGQAFYIQPGSSGNTSDSSLAYDGNLDTFTNSTAMTFGSISETRTNYTIPDNAASAKYFIKYGYNNGTTLILEVDIPSNITNKSIGDKFIPSVVMLHVAVPGSYFIVGGSLNESGQQTFATFDTIAGPTTFYEDWVEWNYTQTIVPDNETSIFVHGTCNAMQVINPLFLAVVIGLAGVLVASRFRI